MSFEIAILKFILPPKMNIFVGSRDSNVYRKNLYLNY